MGDLEGSPVAAGAPLPCVEGCGGASCPAGGGAFGDPAAAGYLPYGSTGGEQHLSGGLPLTAAGAGLSSDSGASGRRGVLSIATPLLGGKSSGNSLRDPS